MTREEAIKELKGFIRQLTEGCQEAIKVLIPELKESEEEKARKWIYDYIRNCPNESFEFYGGIGKKAVLAWLEKQKEQTFESVWHKEECQRIIDEGQGLTQRFKDLFKEVCKAFYEAGARWQEKQKSVEYIKFDNEFENQISHLIASVLNGEHEYNEGFVKYVAQSLLGYASKEQKSQNTKSEINFANKYSHEVWEKLMSKFKAIKGYQIGANDVSDIVLNAILNAFKWQQEQKSENNSTREKIISRATSEKQVVLISESSGEAEIGWDTRSLEDAKRLLEYGLAFINNSVNSAEKQKEQKPAEWSEEDEEMLNSCISSIEESKENRYAYKENDGDTSYDREIAWLKSLRPQSKVEWSEEDEYKLNFLTKMLDGLDQREFDTKYMKELSSWLKSFLERFNLQPQAKQEQKSEAKLTGWVVRNKNEELWLYSVRPNRDSEFWAWMGGTVMPLDQKSFPDLKWEDEPVEVEVTIKKK